MVMVLVRGLFALGLIGHMVANHGPSNTADDSAHRSGDDSARRGAGDSSPLDTLIGGVRRASRA